MNTTDGHRNYFTVTYLIHNYKGWPAWELQLQQLQLKSSLDSPPLHLQVEAEAKAGNYRLYCNDQWKPKSEGFGYAYMTQEMKKRTHPTDGV
jgi:hypothetical protein